MEAYGSLPLDLARTGASPEFVYPAWANSTYYAKNAIVRASCSGTYYDFRCTLGHTSSSWNGPVCSGYSFYWARLGQSSTTGGFTFTTNVRVSNATAWASGSSISAGDVRFDDADFHDYAATVALTSGQNTLRPSEAMRSGDELIRQRWVDLGAANAFAVVDDEIDSQLEGRDSSGNILSFVEFRLDVTTGTPFNSVSFFGLENIDEIETKVYVAGSLVQTVTKQIDPGDDDRFYGISPKAARIKVNDVAAGSSCYLVIKATQGPYPGGPILMGLVTVGYGASIGCSLYGLNHSYLSFSTIGRDQTFGTTRFIKRGTAAIIRATVAFDPRAVPTYAVLHLLRHYAGNPTTWDFNNEAGQDPSLLVFGFAREPSIVLENANHCVMSLEIEGLVE